MNDFGLQSKDSKPIALRGITVKARIASLLAQTTLTQKYQNDSETNLELAYTFPLPVNAVLLSFAVNIGEKSYQGEVIPRKQAEVAYEEAIAEGNSAFRVQEIKPGIYNATLGNVMTGETVEISLTYAETLEWNGSSIRYRLPTTIAPRYGEAKGFQPWQKPATELAAEYPLTLEVAIEGALARTAIACPSHKVSFKPGADRLLITLAKGASMDRDFILEIDNESVQSLAMVATARDTHVALLTLLPPPLEHEDSARDLVIVLDCSGSMAGDSLRLAKEGVQLALGSLKPGERFGVMGFGNLFAHFDKELQPANRKNIDAARRFVQELGDMGGTELTQALELALAYASAAPMDILLLTDGETWNIEGTTAKAKEKGIRIFTVGIGSAVAEDNVRALAEQTGGVCELVSPTEDMSARIFRHFKRMRQPESTRLDIRWPIEPLWESRPERGCFAGDSYSVVAAFASLPEEPVQVAIEYAGHPAAELAVALDQAGEIADAVVRLAARQRLPAIPAEEQQDWAVRYQLMTKQTDYLITVERAAEEKAEALPELQVVAQMLPAGWGGTSSVAEPCPASRVDMPVFLRKSVIDNIDFNPIVEMPAVIRRKARQENSSLPRAKTHPYVEFLHKLNAHACRKFFGKLPTKRIELNNFGLPLEIAEVFDAYVLIGHSEHEVLMALYQALMEHDGHAQLGSVFTRKATGLIGSFKTNTDMVLRFLEVMNRLWARHENNPAGQESRYDIPAFLRKQAE